MRILFVCSGNVCRSVIAERLTLAYASERRINDLAAESAGTRALVGYPVEPRAAAVIEGLGGNVIERRARRVDAGMIARANLVLTMTEDQRDRVGALAAGSSMKSFTLTEAHLIAVVTGADTVARLDAYRSTSNAEGIPAIPDPVGLSERKYVETGDRIAAALFPLLDILTTRHAGNDPATAGWRGQRYA
ncbi:MULTISPECIES: arsenate reductase/protein-tyrosine-phosphatase family protein [unclassified Rhodococcus (in: high G+C Gram-positive bacteria)]|uniref:arsenate reductase/protein-tyrosine-phosphatase family protein n=1 Tax=Rhodococcus sp. SJ-3 TaxID=3454628 RepID=UPI003F7B274F